MNERINEAWTIGIGDRDRDGERRTVKCTYRVHIKERQKKKTGLQSTPELEKKI